MPEETTPATPEPVPATEEIILDLRWRDTVLKIAVPTALVVWLVSYLVPKLLVYLGV